MSKRNLTSSNSSSRTTTVDRPSSRSLRSESRMVYDPNEYSNGVYERTHSLSNMNMSIRREDTRHGGTSEVTISRGNGKALKLTLSEARSLKAFLDRELAVRAR